MSEKQTHGGFLETNGARLYYEVTGEGEPLVFAHAGIADHRLWDDQVPVFSQKYRVIRYDMRGFGQSEPVEGEFAHREDLYELLKFLNVEKAHLVGCSIGGGLCMAVALDHPQMARSLTMVCSGPGGLSLDVEIPAIDEQIEAAIEAKDLDLAAELSTQLWFDGIPRTPDQVDQDKRAKSKAMTLLALQHEFKGLGQHKPPQKPSATERLDELNIPVLAIVGALDEPYTAAAANYMAEHIQNFRQVTIEDTAHLPSLERPDEFNRILSEFLSSL